MRRSLFDGQLLSLIMISALVASGAQAAAIEKKDEIRVAALALPIGRRRIGSSGIRFSPTSLRNWARIFNRHCATGSEKLFSMLVMKSFNY
jgi:hypothetical protein